MEREEILVPCDVKYGIYPRYATEHASGADLHAAIDVEISIPPGGWRLVPTGFRCAIPFGFEGQVRPRSGLAARFGVTILNSPGTIDADYRGEIEVPLINFGTSLYRVCPGDRIAQLVIVAVERARFVEDRLDATPRAEGGFGSTGW